MKSKILLIFLLLTSYVQAQKTLTILESSDGFTDIQGYALGDSIFLTYYNAFAKKSENFCAAIITPEGKRISLILPELYKKTLLAATHSGDSLCIYYVDKDKNAPIALIIDKTTFVKKLRVMNIPNEGVIKAAFVDSNMFLTFIKAIDKSSGTLSFLEVRNGLVVGRKEFPVMEEMNAFVKLKTTVISPESVVRAEDAIGQIKIYPRGNFYNVTLEYPEEKRSTYIVLTLNKSTGTVDRWKFQKGLHEDFTSFLAGNKLVTVTNKADLEVAIYDVEKRQLADSFLISRKSEVSKEEGTYRDDMGNYVTNKYPVKKIVKAPGTVFVAAYEADSQLTLKLGTHQIRTPYFPVVSGLGLAVQLMTAMVSIGISAQHQDSLDQYFYLAWNGNSYTYVAKPALADRVMDEFESTSNISYKAYLNAATTTYGIYKFSYDKLWILTFKR